MTQSGGRRNVFLGQGVHLEGSRSCRSVSKRESLESGQRAAIEAVRKFVDTVDEALPAVGERPSRRQEIVDAAMEMADRLVRTQYDFLRHVVQSAGKTLSRPDDGK